MTTFTPTSTRKTSLPTLCCTLLFSSLLLGPKLNSFPPAPHHEIYGMVRDEWGNPLDLENATVILETANGETMQTDIITGVQPGRNYRLTIPIDTRVTQDRYRRNALAATTPFRMQVQIGQTLYRPIEMSGEFAQVGAATESQRINLTLGEDSDGDGLPDVWEKAIWAASGGQLSSIDPHDDADQDGLSNLEEYQAGTFAYDANDGFSLRIVEASAEQMTLEFMSIRGRSYSLYESSDFNHWQPTTFRLATPPENASEQLLYQADQSGVVTVIVSSGPEAVEKRFFKLHVE